MKYTQEQQAEILAGVSRLGRRIAVTDHSGAVSLRTGNQGGTTGITARPSFDERRAVFFYALQRVDDGTSETKNHPLNGWR